MGCGSSSDRIIGFSSRAHRNPTASSNPDPNQNPAHLCRDRAEFIRSACDRRYAAAAAHVDYLRSLSALGESLCQFASGELSTSAPGSPVLTLPTSSKAKSKSVSNPGSDSGSSTVTPLSHSLSFEDDEEKLNPNSSTVTPLTHDLSVEEKRTVQEPELNTSTKVEEEGSGSSPKKYNMEASKAMPSPNNSYNPSYYPYPYPYDYAWYGYGYEYDSGLNTNPNFDERPGPSNPVTPPMPVQESSGWLDPFLYSEQFMDRYFNSNLNANLTSNSNSYHSSPDSNKVRKQEGIPDLEDEIKFYEKQKEIEIEKQNEKEVEKENEKGKENEKDKEDENGKESTMDPSSSTTMERLESVNTEEGSSMKNKEVRFDDEKATKISNSDNGPTMEKLKSVSTEEGSGMKNKEVRFEDEKATKISNSDNGPTMLVAVRVRDLDEVIEDIREQFHFAADCAKEVSDMLEVDKVQYRSSAFGGMFIASIALECYQFISLF